MTHIQLAKATCQIKLLSKCILWQAEPCGLPRPMLHVACVSVSEAVVT